MIALTTMFVGLVRIIAAVILAVTKPTRREAASILAAKLSFWTYGLFGACRLVRIVGTVPFAVAHPLLIDAMNSVCALELRYGTRS